MTGISLWRTIDCPARLSKKMKTIIIAAIILSSSNAFAWNEYQTGKVETLKVEDYALLFYQGNCNTQNCVSGIEIYRGDELYVFAEECEVKLYNFCGNTTNFTRDCLFRDINNDSIPEVILSLYWGGQHCCVDMNVYSLSAPNKIIDSQISDFAWADIEDLDGDSIPEFGTMDRSWFEWKSDRWNNPCPRIIRKWDGEKYRIANYRFPEYVAEWNTEDALRKLKKACQTSNGEYNPNDSIPEFPPSEMGKILVSYMYAGQAETAREVLDNCWPDNIAGKERYYQDLWDHLLNTRWWNEISNSRW